MKLIITCTFLLLYNFISFASSRTDSLVKELNQAIKDAPVYDADKLKEIGQLKKSLKETSPDSLNLQYAVNLKLYEQFKSYNYDSALDYAKNLRKFAEYKNEPSLLADAKIKMVFIMLSGGLFKETFDSLNQVTLQNVSTDVKADYYSISARYYYDLADFTNDDFDSPFYTTKANLYIDSSLNLYAKNSFEYTYFSALKFLKKGIADSALINLYKLIAAKSLSYHQIALCTSMIGGILTRNGHNNQAKDYLIQAAIADIKSSTKETLALLNLANMLFKQGYIKNAALYIEKANADATFYNARLRKVQIAAILPVIEGEMINTIEIQKEKLVASLIFLVLLVLLLVGLAIIIRKQVAKLRTARANLLEANLKLQEINHKLIEANELKEKYNGQLQVINHQLLEANKIKEEYIGYYFSMDTEFMARVEKLINSIDKRLAERKWDEIKFLLKSVDLKKEKEELLKNFDKVFVRLFPNFVAQFNTLFKEDDKIILKDGQLLNSELRIFALIRLGITDNEKVAEILDYSINTIYAKKTKIRNKAIISRDEFEKKIKEITTLDL